MLIYVGYGLLYFTYYTFACLFWIGRPIVVTLCNFVCNCGCGIFNYAVSLFYALTELVSSIALAIKGFLVIGSNFITDFLVVGSNLITGFFNFCWFVIESVLTAFPSVLSSILYTCIDYYVLFVRCCFDNLEVVLIFVKDYIILELYDEICILAAYLKSTTLTILRFATFGCIDKEGWLWSMLGGEKPDIFSILTLNPISVTFFVALGLLFALSIARYKYPKLFKVLKSTCAAVAFSLFIKLNMLIGRRNTTLLTVFIRLFSLQPLNSEQTAIVLLAILLIPFAILSLSESPSFTNLFIWLVIISFDALLSKDFFILTVEHIDESWNIGFFSGNNSFNVLMYVCTAFFHFYILIFAFQIIVKSCKILFQKKKVQSL